MKLAQTIEDVYAAETGLARQLLSLSARHVADPDVYAMGRTLAKKCAEHLDTLTPHAQRHGAPAAPKDLSADLTPRALDDAVEIVPAAGLHLLHDLRRLYPIAHEAELNWVILLQGALAIRDTELVDVLRPIQEEAQHRWQWLRTRIKDASPQVLAMG
ncbi:hypothetical protein HDA40_001725 [Hamadaea flava]|uniref:DUF892 family protein n=1 Tax=Hamadaea flava TaxID=1742688 RepID=A0ABV8LPC2_9ACTN|nr:hypothetical protein [Hamadaea flava]MCP2323218.1 hypothetical protein [Hamadaea flava]